MTPTWKKISAWLCRAGAECYSSDQPCVGPPSIVLVVPALPPGKLFPLYLHARWAHPCCCSFPADPAVPPALASLLPVPCRCLHRWQSNLLRCLRLRCPRGARAWRSLRACRAPAKGPVPVHPVLGPLLLFSNSALGEDQRTSRSTLRCSPRGSDDGVGVKWLHSPRGHGCLCPRGSGKPWPGTPTLSHRLRQGIWSDRSETRGSVWVSTKIPSGSCCVGSRCCCVPRGYTVCRDAGSC